MNIEIENEDLFRKVIQETGFNLILGAGFSLLASDTRGNPLPLGFELRDELIEEFKTPQYENLDLDKISTILESKKPDEFREYLTARFMVADFDKRYRAIGKLPARAIFSTNIDNLIHQLFPCHGRYLNDITISGPSLNDTEAVDYIPLNGCIVNPGQHLTFSTLDLASGTSLDRDRWAYLTHRLQSRATVVWGHQLADAGVLDSLNPKSIQNRPHKEKWALLREGNEGDLDYLKAIGFFTILGDTDAFLEYLKNTIAVDQEERSKRTNQPTHIRFPNESLPSIGKVAVRPVDEFFLGAQPSWHDIFSGLVPRVSHLSKILNSISSKKNTIIIGMPASGKSTLLMQAANDALFTGHKLIVNEITRERASAISDKLGNESALVFIDNFADSLDAVTFLAGNPNIKLVLSERDYNFEFTLHRLDRDLFDIFDVTELTDQDFQTIFKAIPSEIRMSKFREPKVEEGAYPSLYEIVELNVMGPTLKERFRSVLKELKKSSQAVHDLFIMTCYLHACRTLVSFDVAYAFLGDLIDGFDEVYELFDRCGAMISDANFGHVQLVDENQDFFTARSNIISEAVLGIVKAGAFKKVLVRFHELVSPYRIPNFHIFRRYGFDERYARKAFKTWKEGMTFYENVYHRDESPFLLQQGALFLMHKNRFKDAFTWIDRALIESNYRIPSIRNTHAIILFRANIAAAGTSPEVDNTLKRSMDILTECYNRDRKKLYHALVFGDQAMQYFRKVGDDTAHHYVKTAKEWLNAESKRSPWHRGVKRLLNSLNRL